MGENILLSWAALASVHAQLPQARRTFFDFLN
jgi:hypothetical protein